MKRLLLVTSVKFPDSTAMSVRIHILAKLFQSVGWDVLVLTRGQKNDRKVKEFEGVSYLSVSGKNQSKLSRGTDLMFRIPMYERKFLKTAEFDAVLPSAAQWAFTPRRKNAVKNKEIYFDAVEWYSPSHFKKKEKDPAFRRYDKWMTQIIDKRFRIISISSYLDNYFKSRDIRSVRIPAVLDVEKIDCTKDSPDDKTVIMYAGSPSTKDYLVEILEACACLSDDERARLEFHIIGITENGLTEQCDVSPETIQNVGATLKCFGYVPHEVVLEELRHAHFSVLLRPENERYAQAGFPTKVPEGLASGTPFICNLTSDLGMYLHDGENAIILQSRNNDDVVAGLRRALNMTAEEKRQMSLAARKTAEDCFDYRLYQPQMEQLTAD